MTPCSACWRIDCQCTCPACGEHVTHCECAMCDECGDFAVHTLVGESVTPTDRGDLVELEERSLCERCYEQPKRRTA